jgi:hypothetical protein
MVSLISAAFMPDYTGKDISMEYDHAAWWLWEIQTRMRLPSL